MPDETSLAKVRRRQKEEVDQANSPEEWWRLVDRCEAVAKAFVDDRKHAAETRDQAGRALEYALKAVIMRRERLNCWPDREGRSELYTHDLDKLLKIADIDREDVPRPLLPKLMTLRTWKREHAYAPGKIQRKVARDFFDAAFGQDSVIKWLKSL